ncbi:hypothetical protein EVAR_29812_1 [Eumeta japonica]|uniref:Uncharacterized protein n=1 Tax=Eumeta variegata TaxID=151549 RepID=A0A4C1XNT2_EUMVA|nr:hypothetical protein EVAR_29812_1 [Eumeta japonica]
MPIFRNKYSSIYKLDVTCIHPPLSSDVARVRVRATLKTQRVANSSKPIWKKQSETLADFVERTFLEGIKKPKILESPMSFEKCFLHSLHTADTPVLHHLCNVRAGCRYGFPRNSHGARARPAFTPYKRVLCRFIVLQKRLREYVHRRKRSRPVKRKRRLPRETRLPPAPHVAL